MAIFDIFKKEKEEKKPVAPSPTPVDRPKKTDSISWKVIREPYISEKTTELAKENKYVFKVFPGANKNEIKKAMEELYGVNVVSVKIINIPRKRKRLGRFEGWRGGFKKAIVEIKKGQQIDIIPT